ncbi:hypothetical protein MKW94_014070, partial [Papaver nudicaule]|nr:hypothetical protein [Papaver nudicaule]
LGKTTDHEEEQRHNRRLDPEPVPYIVLVQGPPNVGKSLLIKSLVKVFTRKYLNDIQGPITVMLGTYYRLHYAHSKPFMPMGIISFFVTFSLGKHRRLQFVECPNDVNGMIDAAKYADLVLLCIDASYGFEMVSHGSTYCSDSYSFHTKYMMFYQFRRTL